MLRQPKQSSIQFESIINTSSDGIIIVDKNGIVRFVNPAAAELFERSQRELQGSLFGFPLVASETTELDIVPKGEGHRVAEMRVVEIKWDDDIAYLATLRDVTKRTLRETQISERNRELEQRVDKQALDIYRLHERLSVIFDTTSDAILLLNADGFIELANPAFEQLFGYAPDEFLMQHVSMVVVGSQRLLLEEAIHQIAATGESTRTEISGMRADGSSFDVEVSLARVVNNEGHVVCNLHDISHFKSLERMKNDFVSMVNHELRTPITSTLLAVQMVYNYFDRMTPENAKAKLEQCKDQIGNLREVVDGIMDLSEVEGKERNRGTIPVSVVDSLEKVVSDLTPHAQKKNQTLMLHATDNNFTMIGSALDFTRIWRNLISNAIKYTPEDGSVNVRLARVQKDKDLMESDLVELDVLRNRLKMGGVGYVVGQVQDDGYGIQEQDMAGLFERFNRGWAKSSGIPGTGLGLALVRELLNIYEGDIHVSSELDVGSTFTFWIPLR